MAPLAQVPQVNCVAVLASEQEVRLNTVLDHFRRAPFAGDGNVVTEMPPEVVSQVLGAAIDLPAPEHVETLMVEQEESARPVAIGSPQRAYVDRVRTAMDRVGTAVAGAGGEFGGFDNFDDFRSARVGFRIDHVDARRAQPRYDQVAALDMRMRCIRAECCVGGGSAAMV